MDVTSVLYRKVFILGLSMWVLLVGVAQAEGLVWTDISNDLRQKGTTEDHEKARYLSLDNTSLAQSGLTTDASVKKVNLPLANGKNLTVKVVSSSLISDRLAKKFNIYSYRVLPDNNVISGRLGHSIHGFHAMIQMRSGDTFFIDPFNQSLPVSNRNLDVKQTQHISYRKQDQTQTQDKAYSCGVKASQQVSFSTRKRFTVSSERSLLTYKIAIAATGEYVANKGGTVAGALAAIATTLSRVNQVYEHDLGIHLELVDNNDELIYLDASTDPYTADDLAGLINQNQHNINRVIGVDNYDIGHLFTTKGGGLSLIGSVCDKDRKAQGISGISNPSNDSFNLDFVAHEIGHQLGATHTFNGMEGLCSSRTRTARTAFEPGSGSTVMSYAGYCGVDNLQSQSDPMFHIGSINQVRDFTTNDKGNQCGIRRQAQNSPPNVNAGRDYTIPALTPFELTGSATDNDDDQLVFAWEQIDSGTQSQPTSDTGDNPLFRVHFPTSSKTRSFPPIANILNHSRSKGEALPTKQRLLNFSFVAQDGYNAAESDEMSIKVLKTGSRFALNMPRTAYSRGETHKILWNTANTEQQPINCDTVDVHISHDGGWNFERQLATAIPNSGEAWITIPADFPLTQNGRFKLNCSDNIFFAVSYRDFRVGEQGEIIAALYHDEDMPEQNLSDREQNVVNTQAVQSSSQNLSAAGGSMGWLFFFCSSLIVIKRKTLRRKRR